MSSDRQDSQRALRALAYRQAGYFTAAQALRSGYSYQTQKYHLDRGNWLRVDRGIFRLPDWPAELDDIYVRWTLWSGGQGVVSHESALGVHDLGVSDPSRLHLTVPAGFRARDAAVVVHVGDPAESDVVQREGFRVTSVLRTLLDVSAGALQEPVDDAVTEALDRQLVSPGQLRLRADAFGDRAALRVERALHAAGK